MLQCNSPGNTSTISLQNNNNINRNNSDLLSDILSSNTAMKNSTEDDFDPRSGEVLNDTQIGFGDFTKAFGNQSER